MTFGKLILLNGTSCSGKTAVASALQAILAEPYLTVDIKQFLDISAALAQKTSRPSPAATGANLDEDVDVTSSLNRQLVVGMHQTTLTLVSRGHNVIAEHTLLDPSWLRACVTQFDGLPALLVGVRCPLVVLEQRAAARGHQQRAQVRTQFTQVHAPGVYDLEVDTSLLSPAACAQQIQDFLQLGKFPIALSWLKAYTSPAKHRGWLRLPTTYEGY